MYESETPKGLLQLAHFEPKKYIATEIECLKILNFDIKVDDGTYKLYRSELYKLMMMKKNNS
jgi:hypothetical protein